MALTCVIVHNNVKIDPDLMHPRDLDILTRHTIRAARRFFEKPGVREDFKVWLAQQQAQGRYLDAQLTPEKV